MDAADKGVGLLRHQGKTPVRLRSFHLSDDQIKAIAARAEALRGQTSEKDGRAREAGTNRG